MPQRLEDYYNDGSPQNTRKDEKIQDKLSKKIQSVVENSEERLEKLQEEYLNPNNPALWDGEF